MSDNVDASGLVGSTRLELAKMAIEAVKFHMDTVLRMFPAELAQLNVDDDIALALKVLRRVTG